MQQPISMKKRKMHPTISHLYRCYASSIFTYLYLHVHSHEDAEDILTEVFIAACQSPSLLTFVEPVQKRWLWRVARNKLADYHRSPKNRAFTNVDDIADQIYEDETKAPEILVERDEVHQYLRAQIQQLSPLQQFILQLRFAQEWTCGEIAVAVGKSEPAVRMILSRTLNQLRSLYAREG